MEQRELKSRTASQPRLRIQGRCRAPSALGPGAFRAGASRLSRIALGIGDGKTDRFADPGNDRQDPCKRTVQGSSGLASLGAAIEDRRCFQP